MREPRFTKMEDRIMTKIIVDPGTSCWHWTGVLSHNEGYGIISMWENKKCVPRRAHRFAYVLFRGPIPKGLQIDHLCRVHDCVNPWHLEPVTSYENTRRGFVSEVQKAINVRRTHCKHGHALSGDNLYSYIGQKGFPIKGCRACRKVGDRKYKAKRRAR